MPPTPPNQQMGEIHEKILAAANGGTKTRASGSQWTEQADGRNHHDLPFAFRWDGKSTRARQIAITLDMIQKIRDQAHGERPQIGLLWFGNEALTQIIESWIAVPQADWEEVLPAARAWVELEAALGHQVTPERVSELLAAVARTSELQRELDEARIELDGVAIAEGAVAGELEALRAALAQAEADRERYKAQAERQETPYGGSPTVPGFVPRLPWTVIHIIGTGPAAVRSGIYYDPRGYQSSFGIGEVRVERTGHNHPKLMVNNRQVRDGDMYVDGILQVRVSTDPEIGDQG